MRIRYLPSEKGKIQKASLIYERYEHGISGKSVGLDARKVIRRLRRFGYPSYIVGGAVRDLMIGRLPKDYDIATAAPLEDICKLFRNSRVIGRRFPLVHILFHSGVIEASTFCSTGKNNGIWESMQGDANRRDFSINALYFCPEEEIVLDYVNGFRDFKRKLLRPILPVESIFKEDPVRIIRAIKYSALTGFTIPALYRRRMISSTDLLKDVPSERKAVEMEKILKCGYARAVIQSGCEYKLMSHISEELSEMLEMYPQIRAEWVKRLEEIDNMVAKHRYEVHFSILLALYICEFLHVLLADGQLEHRDVALTAQIRDLLAPTLFPNKYLRDASRYLIRHSRKFFPRRYIL